MSSWPYKEGKASREDMLEGYQRDRGGGRCMFTLDPNELAHYPLPRVMIYGLCFAVAGPSSWNVN